MRIPATFLVLCVSCLGQVSFRAPQVIPLEFPRQVLEADFNNDGRPDLLILDIQTVEIALNLSGGSFSPLQTVQYLGYPSELASADVNRDGKTDIIVLESPIPSGPGTLLVYLGKGDGTFSAPISVGTLDAPGQMVVGDFLGDGSIDVAVFGITSVQVFPGLGNGSFGTPIVTTFSTFYNNIGAAADFNRDGKLDIAIASNLTTGGVLILSGNGDGTFTTSLLTPEGAVGSLSAHDLNGDGKPDLLLGSGTSVTPYFNDGAAHFTPGPAYVLPSYASQAAFGDINHDGKLDIVVACSDFDTAKGGAVSVLMGNGDGTFQSAINSLVGTDAFTLALARFDGTPQFDVAFTDDFSIEISHGDGKGHFVQPTNYTTASNSSDMRVGDFLNTGYPGVAIAEQLGEVQVWPGEAGGVFGKPQTIQTQYYIPAVMAEGDFNGDGTPDIVVGGSQSPLGGPPFGMQVFLGGAGGLQPLTAKINLPILDSLAVGDLNHDGKQDVVYVGQSGIAVAFGDGQGNLHFGPVQSISSVNYLSGAAVADLNGDGIMDVVTGSKSPSTIVIWIGNGDGTFQAPVVIPVDNDEIVDVATGDFNRDGIMDIAAAADYDQQVCVLLGTGGGQFGTPTCIDTGRNPVSLAILDLNGDGYLDIASAGYNADAASVLLGNGDGTFQSALSYGAGSYPIAIGAADLNGDGRPDLIVANSFSDNFSVLLNTTRKK